MAFAFNSALQCVYTQEISLRNSTNVFANSTNFRFCSVSPSVAPTRSLCSYVDGTLKYYDVSLPNNAYFNCASLTSLNITSTVTSIGIVEYNILIID